MFGRVRAALSTPNELEMGRSPSKLIKDDSLSIYETTLLKLKLGARCVVGQPPLLSTEMETDCDSAGVANISSTCCSSQFSEADCSSCSYVKSSLRGTPHEKMVVTDTDCSSGSILPSCSNCQPTCSMKQQQSKTVSVLHFFSKYRSSGRLIRPSEEEVMMIDTDDSSFSNLPNSSNSQSLNTSNEQLEQDWYSSVCQLKLKLLPMDSYSQSSLKPDVIFPMFEAQSW